MFSESDDGKGGGGIDGGAGGDEKEQKVVMVESMMDLLGSGEYDGFTWQANTYTREPTSLREPYIPLLELVS